VGVRSSVTGPGIGFYFDDAACQPRPGGVIRVQHPYQSLAQQGVRDV
jgi:hypothetical protein